MEVLSTVDAWLEMAQLTDPADRARAWRERYEAAFPSVFEVYYRSWGQLDRRTEAARSAPGMVERVRDAELRARRLLALSEGDFYERGLVLGEGLHAVLLVGGHTSNGWVADHEGRPTLFLALEFLAGPPYDELLVVHELTHVVQGQLCSAARSRTHPSSFGVLLEGAAAATSRILRPGHTDSAYLWMDDDHHEWIGRCQASARDIATLLLTHLETPDDGEAVAPLFRNVNDHRLPPRSAYWAGDQIARQLLDGGTTLIEMLSCDPTGSRNLVSQWAQQQL